MSNRFIENVFTHTCNIERIFYDITEPCHQGGRLDFRGCPYICQDYGRKRQDKRHPNDTLDKNELNELESRRRQLEDT